MRIKKLLIKLALLQMKTHRRSSKNTQVIWSYEYSAVAVPYICIQWALMNRHLRFFIQFFYNFLYFYSFLQFFYSFLQFLQFFYSFYSYYSFFQFFIVFFIVFIVFYSFCSDLLIHAYTVQKNSSVTFATYNLNISAKKVYALGEGG